ncbi:hypothetical protein [Magnetospirillum sp. XM-1]|nr:hypothetical protein [Magnetospirillum sp. XM-1]
MTSLRVNLTELRAKGARRGAIPMGDAVIAAAMEAGLLVKKAAVV